MIAPPTRASSDAIGLDRAIERALDVIASNPGPLRRAAALEEKVNAIIHRALIAQCANEDENGDLPADQVDLLTLAERAAADDFDACQRAQDLGLVTRVMIDSASNQWVGAEGCPAFCAALMHFRREHEYQVVTARRRADRQALLDRWPIVGELA